MKKPAGMSPQKCAKGGMIKTGKGCGYKKGGKVAKTSKKKK